MTDISHEDHELISRYLAKRLTDAEELMLETRIVNDPQFRSEVELTAAFRDGLRELEKRGEVPHLLASPTTHWRRPQNVLAAALAFTAIGLISLLFYQQRSEFAPPVATETLRFETTRSGGAEVDVVWKRTDGPVRLDMRFDVGPEPAAKYRVTLKRNIDEAADATLDSVFPTSADGEVALSVESAVLEPGDYQIRLEPQPSVGPDSAVTYMLRVS